jgi:hypothetical protein
MFERNRLGIRFSLRKGFHDRSAIADAHANHRRHGVEQRAEKLIEMQITADESAFLAATSVINDRDLVR